MTDRDAAADDAADAPTDPAPADAAAPPARRPGDAGHGMAVRVTADRLLCTTGDSGEKRSRGGILIPATAASKDRLGVWAEVVEIGPLVRTIDRGDKVLFLPDSAIEVDVHGDAYVIVRERDVHAVASAERQAGSTGLYL